MGNSFSDNDNETEDFEKSLIDHTDGWEDNYPNKPKSEITENQDGWDVMKIDEVITEYDRIRDDLLKAGEEDGKTYIYVDEIFPANQRSLWKPGMKVDDDWGYIRWERPHKISSNPHLFRDGISSEDICQGMVGNCWFLASCAAIARSKTRMKLVIPPGQRFIREPGYAGVFHFRFWRFGDWVDVVVDDKLPVLGGKLCFGRSSDMNEYWLPLLEKAYAKLNGSYKALEGGKTSDALEDLTGGMAVVYDLGDKTPSNLRRILSKALRNGTFVCAGITGSGGEQVDTHTGLISSHAYSVLKFAKVSLHHGRRDYLVKMRNPWGGRFEWKRAYSDSSSAWSNVIEEDKERLGVADEDNGEWWMTYDDFTRYYSDVTLCTIGPDFNRDGEATGDRWLLSTIKGSWISRKNAGGSRNNVAAYSKNPQYRIRLIEPDDFDPREDEPKSEGKCTLVVGLMQIDKRAKNQDNLFLAFNIYKHEDTERLDKRYFSYNREVVGSGIYKNIREVTVTVQLPPGNYVLVPSTFREGGESEFLIRIFTEKPITVKELD